MDWSKAKSILIIALIIADIVLIGIYIANKEATETENTEALLSVLGQSNIEVEAPIPKTKGEMAALTVKYREVDESAVAATSYTVENQKNKNDANDYRNAAKEYVGLIGMQSDYAVVTNVDKTGEDEYSVKFSCVIDGYTLDGSYMKVSFAGGKVTGFEANWFEPVGYSENSGETISSRVALLSYMAEKESSASATVKNIEMVYWVDENLYPGGETVSDTALPAWRITVSERRENSGSGEATYTEYDEHINAFKGE